jgi:mono/diheme cytochrome c family protein
MKNSFNISIKVFYGYFLVVVFLLLSCENKDQADGNVPGEDSLYLSSIHGEEMQTYNERLAEQSYLHYCAVCHGTEGKGDGFNAENLEQKPPDFTDAEYMKLLTHEYLVQAILVGGKVINKSPLMPVWGKTLTEDDIQRLAIYVRSFAGNVEVD